MGEKKCGWKCGKVRVFAALLFRTPIEKCGSAGPTLSAAEPRKSVGRTPLPHILPGVRGPRVEKFGRMEVAA